MKARAPLAALVAIAALLAGGGCSTDYEGGDKDEFIARGNAICEAGAAVKPELEELLAERVPTSGELRGFAGDVLLPRLQERVDQLRLLDPPAADRDEVDDIIRGYRKGIDRVSANPTVLAEGDPFIEADSKARSYGLTSCAR